MIPMLLFAALFAVACGTSFDASDSSESVTTPEAPASGEQAATSVVTPVASVSGEQAAVPEDVEEGRSLFQSGGCSACHSTGANRVVGPGLAGIGIRGDDAYIRQSIKDRQAVIVEGYPDVMPDFSRPSDQKVDDLVAYLKTLQ